MTCIHCDPEATGDDAVWRETCDSHDTFTAEHEAADEGYDLGEPCGEYDPDTENPDRGPDQARFCTCGWSRAMHFGVSPILAPISWRAADHEGAQ